LIIRVASSSRGGQGFYARKGIARPFGAPYTISNNAVDFLLKKEFDEHRKNGFKVQNRGYFVYCRVNKDNGFAKGNLSFDIKVQPYDGDDSWVEGTIFDAIECLKSDRLPKSGPNCDFCKYRQAVKQFENE
jgi:hypothetical protein